MIASSIIKAAEELNAQKPIVLRLKGNKSEEAKKMIEGREDILGIYFCDEMDKAAELAVELAKKQSNSHKKI